MNAFVKLRQKISPYLFLVPCLIVFGLFLFYPFAKTIYLSLYKTDKLGRKAVCRLRKLYRSVYVRIFL